MIKTIKKYPLTLLFITAIIVLSLATIPTGETPITIPYLDKIAHFCMYAALELVIMFEYLRKHTAINRLKVTLLGVVAPMLFGGAVELAQITLTQNRSGEWADFFADILGIVIGVVIGLLVIRPLLWRK